MPADIREEMNSLIDFVEKTHPVPLTDFQKDFLEQYKQARKENKKVFVTFPRLYGRRMIENAIREWEGENQ